MKMVVVGGNCRDIGKTSVIAGLISALPLRNWTAIKLTQFGNGICSIDGHECGCAPKEHPFAIQEEQDRSGKTDTSRFLAAGARRALWVRVRWGMLETVIPPLRRLIYSNPDNSDVACGGPVSACPGSDFILESNSILRFFQPDLYLSVLDPAQKDFKVSARQFLDRADAFLLHKHSLENPLWEGISVEQVWSKPVFFIRRNCFMTDEIVDFVETRLTTEQIRR